MAKLPQIPGSGGLSERLGAIDRLRCVAALAVVFLHICHGADVSLARYFAVLPLEFGYLGVHLFLILSGFCIHLRSARNARNGNPARADWGIFWLRRFWRLYPPYVAAIALSLAIYYFFEPTTLREWEKIRSLPWDLTSHLLMVHNLFPDYRSGLGNAPFWTLGLEEQLYLLYFLLLLLRRRLPSLRTVLLIGTVSVTWRAVGYCLADVRIGAPPVQLGEWLFYPLSWWFLWALGAIAAEAYVGVVTLPRWCYGRTAMFASAAAGAFLSDRILGRLISSNWFLGHAGWRELGSRIGIFGIWADLLFGVACFVLLNRTLAKPDTSGWLNSAMERVGVMSYSLYLTHLPILHVVESLLRWDQSWIHVVARYVICVPITIAVAAVFFALVERRFIVVARKSARRGQLANDEQLTVQIP